MLVNDDTPCEPRHDDTDANGNAVKSPRAPHLRVQARAARMAAGEPCATCEDIPPDELLRGIHQFNTREYFECHETLEGIWNREPGPVRVLYKGILQVAVGCYHLLRGNYHGATIKLASGANYLEAFRPSCMRVDVALLIEQARRLRAEVVRLGPEYFAEVDLTLLPLVSLHQ
jgi:predicted metal-dependent hydrolase